MAGGRKRGDQSTATPAHIISRPRLTRLLDQATAKIVILVAPAGYGKTTLAQEWLRDRPHIWYRANAASSDVASLGLDLAEALAGVDGEVPRRMRAALAVSSEPAHEVPLLVDLLRNGFEPDETLIAIDDYDAIAASPVAERLIGDLVASSRARLLVTGRARPIWATARRLLYGEIFELGQSALAMDPDEASRVLSVRPGTELPGLAALAQGWPAVLGLAALTEEDPPAEQVADGLYEFFAEELYQQVPTELREALLRLAFVGSLEGAAVDLVLGEAASEVVAVALRIGFLTREGGGELSAHPLVQGFLEKKALPLETSSAAIGKEVARALLGGRYWDEAFRVIDRFALGGPFEDLIAQALPEMVRTGRLATLERWSEFPTDDEDSPAIDLVKAELALRRATYQAAETMAIRASRGLEPNHELHAQALLVAGNAAHLADHEERGFGHYTRARSAATSDDYKRQAIWGQLICANQLDLPAVPDLISEVEAWSTHSPEDALRLATMKFSVGLRGSGISEALPLLRTASPLCAEARDPLVRTSFLNVYARCLAFGGFYDEAVEIADALLTDARDHELEFVVPHALIAKATGEAGAKRPQIALRLTDEAHEAAQHRNDNHNEIDSRSLKCRIYISLRDFDAALEATAQRPEGTAFGPLTEFALSRALALVGADRTDEARRVAERALRDSGRSGRSHEIRSIARWITAVAALAEEEDGSLSAALSRSVEYGVVDAFVVSYRGFPEVLRALASDKAGVDLSRPILERAGDTSRARAAGFPLSIAASRLLSQRESEVYELLAAGRTNKEIAAALFISDVTVKVHVRHILRKLGARTRTEAVARGPAGAWRLSTPLEDSKSSAAE
jgi:LuxR family maltose regulon positive regulatory protein